MLRRSLFPACLMSLALVATACTGDEGEASVDIGGPDDPVPACDTDTIRFADTQVEALEELSRRFEPFADELAEAFGRDIEFYSVPDRNAAATALELDDVVLVLAGAAEYVVLNAVAGAEPVVALTRDEYYSEITAHADSDIHELEDLEGHSVALGGIGSGTRHIAPMRILVEDGGYDAENDLDVQYLDDAWREAFIAGEVDAIGHGARHIEPVAEELGEENLRTVFTGPEMGPDAFMANPELGEECADELRTAVLDNEEAVLEALWGTADDTDNEKYLDSELVAVDDDEFDTMREAFLAIGIDDFAEFDEDELEREITEELE